MCCGNMDFWNEYRFDALPGNHFNFSKSLVKILKTVATATVRIHVQWIINIMKQSNDKCDNKIDAIRTFSKK